MADITEFPIETIDTENPGADAARTSAALSDLAITFVGGILTYKGKVLLIFDPTISFVTSLDFSTVEACIGDLGPVGSSVTSFDLSALTSVGGTFDPHMDILSTLNAPVLEKVGVDVGFSMPLLATLELPSLSMIGGNFRIGTANSTLLTELNLPALTRVGSIFVKASNLTSATINPGLLSAGDQIFFDNAALDQASVDGLLVLFASLDGTGGTTLWENSEVNLTGTSASPSATGLAAKAVLEGRGNTVTVN